jgi:hypothetical protein
MFNYKSQKQQSGAAVLAFMLVLITGTSYILLNRLNNYSNYARDTQSHIALLEAKRALLSYAMNYPELRSPTVKGPGYLPCPDQNNNGNPTNCGTSVTTTLRLGRLPFRILGLTDLQESGGERLWYAVSDNFKNTLSNDTVLNSEKTGLISVDGVNDIVAVIIAPGAPVGAQSGRTSNDPADYLEDVNAVASSGTFVTSSAAEFNDQLVTITRQELMAAVEKRVLGEVISTLNSYREDPDKNDDVNGIDPNCPVATPDCDDAYPWLTPYADPSTSIFKSEVGTRKGHIAFHWADDPDSVVVGTGLNIAGRNPFSTPVSWSWNIDAGTAVFDDSPDGTVTQDCIENIDCNDGVFPVITELQSPSNVDCTWVDKDTSDCTSAVTITRTVAYDYSGGLCPSGGTLTRTYTVNFPSYQGTSTINLPTSTSIRTRDVGLNGSLPDQSSFITIEDVYTGQIWFFFCFNLTFQTGSASISLDNTITTGSISTNGIKYDIDVDNDELPEWFVKNEWHKQVYISYTSGLEPGSTTNCVPGTDCLNVSVHRPYGVQTNNDIEALVVMTAGMPLSSPTQTRPSANLSDYFEDINAIDDYSFEQSEITSSFNDQIRMIIP